MGKLSRKERREMIAAAMKTISEQEGMTPEARDRGLAVLQKAFEDKKEAE